MNDFSRYARQTMLPQLGDDGQLKLRSARVLLVGAGGLGSAVAAYLAGAGIGHLGIADPDSVSISNLQRQILYNQSQTGSPKPLAAVRRLQALNPDCEIQPFCLGLTPDNAHNIVGRFDLVMDCCDNFATRYLIDDVCADTGRPWVHGALSEFAGQVSVFNYRSGRRYAQLYPDRDYLCSLPHTVKGVIGPVAGLIGCIQACEAIKLIVGFGTHLEGRLFTFDTLDMTTQTIKF